MSQEVGPENTYTRAGFHGELKTVPLAKLFQQHKGYWWVLPGQKEQIDKNLKNIPWHPKSLDKEINLAGIPITREEAIKNTIPEHKE